MRNPIWKEICCDDRRLYAQICGVYKSLPDVIDLGFDKNEQEIELSCHLLARGFANVFPQATCIDGTFSVGFQHSWLLTERHALIDVYPVRMVGGPLLFWHAPTFYQKPSGFLYEENRKVIEGVLSHMGQEQFDRAVQIVTGYIFHSKEHLQ